MQLLALALFLAYAPPAVPQRKKLWDSVKCSQGLGCQLLGGNVLCMPGKELDEPELEPVLVPTEMKLRNKLRCQQQNDCIPCVEVTLHLGLLGASSTEDGETDKLRKPPKEYHTNAQEFLETYILLSARRYTSSRCVAIKVLLPRGHDSHNSTLGFLQFNCFPVALSGELHVTAFTRPYYRSTHALNHTHRGPDCTWHKAKEAIHLCQVPSLKVSVGLEKAVLHIWDIPAGKYFSLWLYLNRTGGLEGLDKGKPKLLTGPENVSLPISQVLPCLCLQVWPKTDGQEDSPRTHLCPFTSDAEALARAWTQSHLELKVFAGTLSCFLSAPCDLPGELIPCWKGEQLACSQLHPQLHLAVTPRVPQEFPGVSPHPNLCVQVRNNGSTYLQSCLLENITGSHLQSEKDLLLWETVDSHGNPSIQVLEQSKWVPIAEALSMRNGILTKALENDLQSEECMQVWRAKDHEAGVLWACSQEKYSRTHWALVWMITLLGICSILFVLLLKKKALKGWIRILKEDYYSGGVLQGRHILILYSPDHAAFERLVGTLAGSLARLQLIVSLELWSRGELGSLGPMQWFHAQRRRVLQEGGAVLLLFSRGAVASCAEWLSCGQKDTLPDAKPDSTFLASLNCILPDFLAGKAKGTYMVACFEELLPVDKIPELFRSVSVYPLPSQVFKFLLALAGPKVHQDQRSSLRKHAVWISKSLEWAVQEYQRKNPSGQYPALLPLQHGCADEGDQASFHRDQKQ